MEKQAAFDMSLLDKSLARQAASREQKRRELLDRVLCLLREIGPQYGIDEAYVFGSVTRRGCFHHNSDVDVAVHQIAPEQFFDAMAALSMALKREVDLIDLRKCRFADRIREEGIRWTTKRSPS